MVGRRRGHGEGSIYRRSDGAWVGAVHLGSEGGRRRRRVVYGKTQAEVWARLREAQRQFEGGHDPAPERLTVEQFLGDWLERVLPGTVNERSEDTYRGVVRLYIVPTIGSIRLAKLVPSDVSRMLVALERRGLAAETRRQARAVLRRALRIAEQDGLIPRNPAAIADGPRIPRREGRTLTPDEARRFLEAIEGERLEAAYVLALALGLRRGEVLGLSWHDVDLDAEAPVLVVRRQVNRGRRGLELSELKTSSSRRTLYLSDPVVQVLRRRRLQQRKEQLAAGPLWMDRDDLVFTSPLGGFLDTTAFGKSVPRLAERAGLGHWTLHELRHSCASLLLAMGVPLEVVSETLGHASIRMTKDVYGHLLAPSRMQAAEAMRRALWADAEPGADRLATNLATNDESSRARKPLTWGNVRPGGFEPPTCGLRVRCSAVELEAHPGV